MGNHLNRWTHSTLVSTVDGVVSCLCWFMRWVSDVWMGQRKGEYRCTGDSDASGLVDLYDGWWLSYLHVYVYCVGGVSPPGYSCNLRTDRVETNMKRGLSQRANVNVGQINKSGESWFACRLHLYDEYQSQQCVLRQLIFAIFTHVGICSLTKLWCYARKDD